MASTSQRKASRMHRSRSAAHGFVRVEVKAHRGDAALIRALAETLREETAAARELRASLEKMVAPEEVRSGFDIFGSDLPDEAFEGIFDQPRQRGWREIDL